MIQFNSDVASANGQPLYSKVRAVGHLITGHPLAGKFEDWFIYASPSPFSIGSWVLYETPDSLSNLESKPTGKLKSFPSACISRIVTYY